MKLDKGTLKVVTISPKALKENAERTRNRGLIMVPPFTIWEWDEGAEILLVHSAFDVRGKFTTRTSYGKFPYVWAPRELNEQHAWFETESEVDLNQIQPRN